MKTIPLQELLAKATPGPYRRQGTFVGADENTVAHCDCSSLKSPERTAFDALLLAHAANHIGPLVEALEAVLRCHYAWVDDQDSEKAHALYVAADRADKALADAKNVEVGP